MKKTCSKLDIGYASEEECEKKPIFTLKKSQSDSRLNGKLCSTRFSSLTHSLPLFEHEQKWRHSITSAYDTCSNPDIDRSLHERRRFKPSLLMYKKKYLQSPFVSNSYDASVEYTDDEPSENDLDFMSPSINDYQNSPSFVYHRYMTTTTTTTTTGYSSDIEHETTTTLPSDVDEQRLG